MRLWQDAWQDALYGERGFYRSAAPAAHFRTSVQVSPLFAAALARLAGGCGLRRVVDVGSGRGELLAALAVLDPALELTGVDVGPRPAGLPASAAWRRSPGGAVLGDRQSDRLGDRPSDRLGDRLGDRLSDRLGEIDLDNALVVANEWLDDVPCPVVQVDGEGTVRRVLVAPDGSQRLGPRAGPDDLAWLRSWWPLDDASPGSRAEVGRARDQAWRAVVDQAQGSVLVAADYAHERGHRPRQGSLAAFRGGRRVEPVPDGSCDLTAHVALDAVAAAAPARWSLLTTQREALTALGVRGQRPRPELARSDPGGYLAALACSGEASELIDPHALGGFGWLVQSTGPPCPADLIALCDASVATS